MPRLKVSERIQFRDRQVVPKLIARDKSNPSEAAKEALRRYFTIIESADARLTRLIPIADSEIIAQLSSAFDHTRGIGIGYTGSVLRQRGCYLAAEVLERLPIAVWCALADRFDRADALVRAAPEMTALESWQRMGLLVPQGGRDGANQAQGVPEVQRESLSPSRYPL